MQTVTTDREFGAVDREGTLSKPSLKSLNSLSHSDHTR